MKINKDARVLVVDDEAHQREGLATLLQSWGYEAETASNGREALDKIPSFNPGVVICDLRMPDMSGMDLLRELRHSRPSISFSMLSGQGNIGEAVEATELGAFNFLEKPFDVKKLQARLRN